MKILKLIILLVFLQMSIFAEIHSLVRVHVLPPQDEFALTQTGISLEGAAHKKGQYWDVIVSETQLDRLVSENFSFEILISDMTKFYQDRFDSELAKDFGLGSMGGFYTFTEVLAELDEMVSQFPELITVKQNIGTSLEGRGIFAVKISDNPNQNETGEPEVLYTALHHAREPQGMMVCIYYMWHLLENYNSDEKIRELVDNRQQWFVPVVNPDGYVYNQTIEPNGGGMQRKNRRPNGCSGTTVGVDLNRNYGFMWGYDNSGSSGYTCDETYRGTAGFSEPETQVIRDFCIAHDFKLALNYHTYSNLLLHPYGYEEGAYPPDDDLATFREYLNTMSGWNGYTVGTGFETLGYFVNGEACDWMYDELGIFACTPEVGGSMDGFWPATNRIVPLAEENLQPNLFWAWMAGIYLEIFDSNINCSEYPDPGENFSLEFKIKNKGLEDSDGNVSLNISSSSQYLQILQSSFNLGSIQARQNTDIQSINLSLEPATPVGEKIVILLDLSDGTGYSFIDSVVFRAGTPTIIFNEQAEEDMSLWETGTNWGTDSPGYQGDFSLTDSPTGNYPANVSNELILAGSVDLSEVSSATLSYMTKWSIESGYDFGQVEVSSDNGNTWIDLQGQNMSIGSGSGVQQTGEYGYDGFQNEWILETIVLDQFVGNSDLLFRFVLSSDSGVEEDGWYLDNIMLSYYPEITFTLGDINFDGKINVTDVVKLINFILNSSLVPTEFEALAADVTNDQNIDISDIVALVSMILNT